MGSKRASKSRSAGTSRKRAGAAKKSRQPAGSKRKRAADEARPKAARPAAPRRHPTPPPEARGATQPKPSQPAGVLARLKTGVSSWATRARAAFGRMSQRPDRGSRPAVRQKTPSPPPLPEALKKSARAARSQSKHDITIPIEPGDIISEEPAGGATPRAESAICHAIRARRLLAFDYDGHGRVAQPYCHGFSKTGHEVVRAIQVRGPSRSRGFGFGKLWTVAKMEKLSVMSEEFRPDDPRYRPDDSAMIRIHCRI